MKGLAISEPARGRPVVAELELRPRRRTGVALGVTAAAILAAGSGFALYRILQQPISLAGFVGALGAILLLGAAVLLAYWAYSCYTLRYTVAGGTLTITWGAVRHVVPLGSIHKVLPGEEVARVGGVTGVSWPGHHVGGVMVPQVGPVLLYATSLAPQDLVFLLTAEVDLALSADYGQLRAALDGVTQTGMAEPMSFHYPRLLALPIWGDRYARILGGLALAASLLLFAFVAYSYPSLPEFLPLHFTAGGTVDRIGYRSEILRLPIMALAVLAANTLLALALHARERLAAYLSLAAALFVQGLFLVAVVKIVG